MASNRAIQFECKVVYLELGDDGLVATVSAKNVVVTEKDFGQTFQEVADTVLGGAGSTLPSGASSQVAS